MSTIEEAREQAREALNSATVARRYAVHPDAGTLERALRTLLDATEPPANVTDLPKSDIPSEQMSLKGNKPAEDEREALAYLITAHRFKERGLSGAIGEAEIAVARQLADTANERFDGSRNPLGMRTLDNYAGDAVPDTTNNESEDEK